jgi:hypothetical protein
MILNIVYLFIGLLIGFLVKHELDLKQRKKRIQKRINIVSSMDMEPYNETLEIIKELNSSLINISAAKKKEVH